MPPYEAVRRRAALRRPFANGTEGEAWQDGWCLRSGAFCRHDTVERESRVGDRSVSCPLLEVAMLEQLTPAEWVDRTDALGPKMYRCTRYEPEGGAT